MARPQRLQRHEILSVGADVNDVMINGVLVAADAPIQ